MTIPTITRTLRREELRELVPLSDTTIYEMERKGEFPRRFYLTARCVAWDFDEVQQWLHQRRTATDVTPDKPDVRRRKKRPVRT